MLGGRTPPPSAAELTALARRTHGFCGADLKALCSEAALRALHATYPQIFTSTDRYVVDPSQIRVTKVHFDEALCTITPAATCPLSAVNRQRSIRGHQRSSEVIRGH